MQDKGPPSPYDKVTELSLPLLSDRCCARLWIDNLVSQHCHVEWLLCLFNNFTGPSLGYWLGFACRWNRNSQYLVQCQKCTGFLTAPLTTLWLVGVHYGDYPAANDEYLPFPNYFQTGNMLLCHPESPRAFCKWHSNTSMFNSLGLQRVVTHVFHFTMTLLQYSIWWYFPIMLKLNCAWCKFSRVLGNHLKVTNGHSFVGGRLS